MDRVIEHKKGIKRKHIYWAIGAIVMCFLLFNMLFASNLSVYRIDKEKVTINEVKYSQFNDFITVTGKVEPISTIFLDAIESGRVVERYIEEGAMVKKGDIILKLENNQLYQTILNSEAALAEKENYLRSTQISFESELVSSKRNLLDNEFQLKRSKRKYEQYKGFYKDGLVAKEEYLRAEEDYEYQQKLMDINYLKAKNDSLIRLTSMKTLEQDLEKMRKNLSLVYERLEHLNVKAPVDGQLGMLDAELGQSIGQGTRIGMINVLTNYKVNASIDEHYIDRVERELTGTFERNQDSYQLHIKKVYPEVRNGKFDIDLVFDGQKPENIRTGQSYHIKLKLGESNKAILINRGSFFQTTGGQWIYVLNDNETEATKRFIKIGKQNPQYYEVIEGLEPGEKVITSSYDVFGDNEKIILR
ncbi:efflux RND transporter periplasmic adaptor subunit [Plebeiibacterium sediminum]|uniref:HlyD family efflux transporter periplasmic adaptor subunit n=1 Tax=Plebeiibacterium sediminum TaxID=2992112 RepID=A0AAE3SEP9_9BACT|nr:HlyD family efflux transporter periplasmic adaptor subunit [Plebeiobacterium sediminum]MCW3786615.1 HlyD family efflux transporter periplasmic adaptor subunit [Plebeiobacterium sediminum]